MSEPVVLVTDSVLLEPGTPLPGPERQSYRDGQQQLHPISFDLVRGVWCIGQLDLHRHDCKSRFGRYIRGRWGPISVLGGRVDFRCWVVGRDRSLDLMGPGGWG